MNEIEDVTEPTQDELSVLKARADQLGISYHPSIGLEKLREKVNAALSKSAASEEAAPAPEKESEAERRSRLKREALKLIRVRITCMNPQKRAWEGEIFTAGNGVIGTVKKYVPFDIEWHVPKIILDQIQARQCQIFQNYRDERGRSIKRGKLIKEFNVEILPPLSEKELAELARRQAMARGQD